MTLLISIQEVRKDIESSFPSGEHVDSGKGDHTLSGFDFIAEACIEEWGYDKAETDARIIEECKEKLTSVFSSL